MKSFSKALAAALLALLAAGSSHLVSAQSDSTSAPPPRPMPTPAKPQGNALAGTSQQPAQPGNGKSLTERERRAAAYAKLMEGQRFLTTITRANMETNLRRAKLAFQEAAQLEPNLAEAHTALAWASFYYPPYDFEEAGREAQLAVNIDRNNFGAHRILSRALVLKSGLREGKLIPAVVTQTIASLREVVRLNPNDAEGWALLGEYYFATDRLNEAIEALTKWSAAPGSLEPRFYQAVTNGRELSPESAAARLSQAYIRAGRFNEATAAIRRALYLDPENKEYLDILSQSLAAGGAGDAAAISELQRMADASPSNLTALRALARAQARAGRINEAVATLRSALVRKGVSEEERVQIRVELAGMLSDAERFTDAVTVYEEMLKERGLAEEPLTDEEEREVASAIFRRIVELQRSAGLSQDATATINRMRRVLGKDDPTADLIYIDLLRGEGKRREALQAIQAARKSFPSDSQFLGLEAQALTDMGRVDEAVTMLRSQIKGSELDFNTYLLISNLYTQAGKGREAIDAARKALEMAPPAQQQLVSAALLTLASAQERAGDPKGSEASIRRVLEKEPDNATALNNLGYFLVERNERLPEALEMIQRAVRAEPTNSSFLDSLGWAYFKMGKLEEAERNLREAAKRDPSSSTIQEHLGDVLQKQGKVAEARVAWQKALGLSTDADETARIKAKLGGKSK
ncbi:MAG TPA: tetratricopeptide repeat protein [Pyrinomonadaceae bacterium]|nr:tetratricopeptide repeat protein [Pyrinomonadaceae bacterium]